MQRATVPQQPQTSMSGVTQGMISAPSSAPAPMSTNYGTQQQTGQVMPGALSMPNSQTLAPGNTQTMSLQQQQAQFQAQQLLQQQAGLQARQNQQHQQHQQMFQQQPQQMQQVNMPQQQIQQQQHIPHQGLNGGWQSDKDTQDRRKMIAQIVKLLQLRKPNAPQEWLKKLPQMAKRLEESLYRSAPSFEAYNDFNTLKQRLQQLAMNIGMNKTKKLQAQAQMGQQQQQSQPTHFPSQQPQLMQQQQQQQQRQQPQQQLNGINAMPMQPVQQQQQQQPMALQQPQMPVQLQPQPPQRTMVNMHEINPIMGQSQTTVKPQQLVNSQNNNAVSDGLTQVASNSFGPQSSLGGALHNALDATKLNGLQQPTTQQQQQIGVSLPNNSNATSQRPKLNMSNAPSSTGNNGANGTSGNGSRPGSDRQQVLRHQQQRLLLLRHAAKCPHEDGQCPVTPHCAGMKRLWKHIAECKDQKCLVPHCVSSRYVLSHYHRCKDVRCPVCGPVREAIHRSHEKAKQQQMQQLKPQHPAPQQPQQPQQSQMNTQQVQQPYTQQLQKPQIQTKPVVAASSAITPNAAQSNFTADQIAQKNAKRRKMTNKKEGASTPNSNVPSGAMPPNFVNKPQMPAPLMPTTIQSQTVQQQKPFVQSQQPLTQQSSQPVPAQVASASVPPSQQMNQNSKPGYVYSQTPSAVPGSVPTAEGSGGTGSKQVDLPAKQTSGPTPQEDHTLINCFSIEQIETHIMSLNKGLQLPPQKLKLKCLEVLKVLQSHQHGWVFNTPVDPVELGLPDYFHVIKRPMDLGTIKRRLENGCYHALEEFEADVHLTFDNAMLYNQEGSVVHNMAKEMKDKFTMDHDQLLRQLQEEEDEKRKNGDACALCGCEKLLFEPPVFYCNGMNCPSKRIRRNSYYYVGGNNQFHWCHQCFGELKDNQTIELGDVALKKSELLKKKNDEVHEESWVQCDKCERWIHQICALFNTRQNKDQRSEYTCPKCTIEDRKKKGITEGTSKTPMAKDLPRTKLSEWLEERVRVETKEFLKEAAETKAETENITVEEAIKAINCGPITIRQVTSMDRKLDVRERMRRRYAFKNYPDEFTYRCKCIIVFQNLDGVDVILFGLYVYEHDENNPPPNKRAVYISYLDSVHYMRPRRMRTFIYHEILIAYLDYVRRKGFSTAHIWACPPLKGDDYILYAKPEDQKTPKDDRLRQWYLDMLVEAQKRGIVGRLTNMYDLYFANEENDASVVPYMEGDYFPAEAENIIKDIEEGKNGKKSGTTGKKKNKKDGNKSKSKNKSGRGGTRSTGIDEEALAASGIVPPGVETKSLQEGGRDFVMAKLGETIHPMRESFIVAFLTWEGVKDENLIVPREIAEYREKNGIIWKLPSKEQAGASQNDTAMGDSKESESEKKTSASEEIANSTEDDNVTGGETKNEEKSVPDGTITKDNNPAPEENGEKMDTNDKSSSSEAKPQCTNEEAVSNSAEGTGAGTADKNEDCSSKKEAVPVREGKLTLMARKRDAQGNSKPDAVLSSSVKSNEKKPQGPVAKVIDDDAEEMDCEFLNNRQAFLNLCQGNHYQFDQLRRAKHTSMMVLWHLHNRDAPKFVQQCAVCSREILTGYRYHCPICADYDQCQECAANPATPRHQHQLKPVPVGQQSELTAAQRKERQRSIQLHMQLLFHAATCVSSKCPSANCTKMKGLLKHGAQCKAKATGGCNVCKRIWALLQIHARQCKQSQCPVPNCMAIRERFRQLTQQQQAMDDRRRQEMNRAYRGAGR